MTEEREKQLQDMLGGVWRRVAGATDGLREMPKREILVTAEMIEAGVSAQAYFLLGVLGFSRDELRDFTTTIYRAMAALAPVDAATGFSEALAALRQRDEARLEITALNHMYRLATAREPTYEATIVAKDTRIAELDTLLAQRPAPVPDTPKPTPDVFRDFSGDRRRVGG